MYKVTYREYIPSPDTAPGFIEERTRLLTAKELVEFSKVHKDFQVKTIKWEPARED